MEALDLSTQIHVVSSYLYTILSIFCAFIYNYDTFLTSIFIVYSLFLLICEGIFIYFLNSKSYNLDLYLVKKYVLFTVYISVISLTTDIISNINIIASYTNLTITCTLYYGIFNISAVITYVFMQLISKLYVTIRFLITGRSLDTTESIV